MIVSIHIPKTGGTSFSALLRSNYGEILEIAGPAGVAAFLRMPRPERSRAPAAAGHMPFGLDRYVDVPCRYVTFLREPVDHVVSGYYYVLNTPGNPQHALARAMTLREYVERDLWRRVENHQTCWLGDYDWTELERGIEPRRRWTSGDPADGAALLAAAKRNLDRCEVVGLFERYAESVALACRRFGLRCEAIPHLNATPGRPGVADLEPGVLALIRDKRRLDIELYAYAQRRFEALLAA